MNLLATWYLSSEITIAEVDNFPEEDFQKLVKENLLNDYPAVPWRDTLTAREKDQDTSLKQRVENRFKLRLVALHQGQIIGLTYGWQLAMNHSDFYMGISAVQNEYRRQGIYGKMMDLVLCATKERGFSAVKSRHVNLNSPVIIAKLKKGFIVTGFELDETMGALVNMTYYHNEARKKAARFRSGQVGERSTLERLLGTRSQPQT